MRIEGGYWLGHVLQAPNSNATRPTDGRTREMLFNSLGEFIVGARVLDLYAGSGAVGLEALSRGAAHCTFVELEHSAVRALRANVKKLRAEGLTQIWAANARTAPQKLADDGVKFDFIFADPPFSKREEGAEIARRLDALPDLLNNEWVETRESESQNQHTEDDTKANGRQSTREGTRESVRSQGSGLIVVQHSRRVELPALEHFDLTRTKKAGESVLSFLRAKAPAKESEKAGP